MPEQAPATTDESVSDRMSAFFKTQEPEAPPAPEPEAAAPEAETEEVQTQASEEEPTQPEEETVEADQLVDVEVEGKVLKVSPEAKDHLMRHADYTKKTMVLADQRNLFQKEREITDAQSAFQKEIEPESKALVKLEIQLDQYKALPWHEMDTDQIVRAQRARDEVREQYQDMLKTVDTKRDDFLQKYSSSINQLKQQSWEYLGKTITGWSKDAYGDSAKAARAVGFSSEEFNNFMDPRSVHLSWKAAQWDKLQESKPQVKQKVSTAPPVTKPGSKANTESQSSQQYRELRQSLKKDGSVATAAKLFMLKGR